MECLSAETLGHTINIYIKERIERGGSERLTPLKEIYVKRFHEVDEKEYPKALIEWLLHGEVVPNSILRELSFRGVNN